LQILRFYLLFCGSEVARLSETNVPVLKTVARFLWKTSVSLHVQRPFDTKTCMFDMSDKKDLGVLTGAGVDVFKYFGAGTGVFKQKTGAESKSRICDSAQL